MMLTRLVIAALLALAPSPQATGRITGHVSTTGNPGERLARAYVSLIGVNSATRRLTMTRDDGTFVFDEVAAGSYVVEAGRLPHLATAEQVTLGPGYVINDLAFRLKRSGVISGHVFDEHGQPASQTIISALRIRYERGGVIEPVSAGYSSTTDRFGEFRIHGLAPGAYVIRTSSRGVRPGAFVPGVAQADAATVFVIDDGTEHGGVNAHLVPAFSTTAPELGAVSGVVYGPDGEPIEAEVAVNYRKNPIGLPGEVGSAGTGRRTKTIGGHFKFETLLPGALRITATVPGQRLEASFDLMLGLERVHDLRLQVYPPQQIVGRVTPEGTDSAERTVVVRSYGGPFAETRWMPVIESGEFLLTLFPGRYIIESGHSVTIDGVDMTDRIFEVKPGVPIKHLEVSFADKRQSITGRVTNATGAGVSAVTVIAFSTNDTDWFHESRRIAIARPTPDGHYELSSAGAPSLPAGEYHLAVVTGLSQDEQYNPAFLRAIVGAAIRVTLSPGQRRIQDVRVQ